MTTAIEYRTQSQFKGELLEGATLFAPSFEATLDRGRRTISYSVADPEEVDPDQLDKFNQGVIHYQHLQATHFPYRLPTLNVHSDTSVEMTLPDDLPGGRVQQLSTVSPHRLQTDALEFVLSLIKFIAELEDLNYYLPAFELTSFFFGAAGEVLLLDLSLLSRDPSHRKSSFSSLAKLIAQLYLSDISGGDPKRVVDTLAGRVQRRRKSKDVSRLSTGARRLIKELTSSREQSLLKVATEFSRRAKLKKERESWKKKGVVTLIVQKVAIPLKLIRRVPLWMLLIGGGTLSVATYRAVSAFNGYVEDATLREELIANLPPGAALLFENRAERSALAAAAKNLPEEQQVETPDEERVRKVTIEYKLQVLRDCSGCNLTGYDFDEDYNLSKVNLSGANLTNASFNGTNIAEANFEGANVTNTSFTDMRFLNVNMSNIVFNNTVFDGVFWDGVNARSSDFRGMEDGTSHDYSIIYRSVDFSYANLDYHSLINPSRTDSSIPESQSEPKNFVFLGASMKGFTFNNGSFRGVDLRNADMSQASFRGTDLTGANMSGANMTGADMFRANLTDIKATGATFNSATLSGAKTPGANFNGADFTRARLKNLKDESTATIDGATFTDAVLDSGTRFNQKIE